MGVPARMLTCVLVSALGATGAQPDATEQFYNAIRADHAGEVADLLRGGASVNGKDSRGGTPLMYAAAIGSEAMLRTLIEAGADVNAKSSFGATALIFAAGSLPRVRLLVEHGADVNARTNRGNTPLLVAAKHAGNLDTVKLLIAKGARLDAPPSEDGETPAAAAAAADDAEMLRVLLDRDVEHNLAGAAGPMTLMNAARTGNLAAVKLLLSKGVPVNAQSPEESDGRVKNGPIAIGHLTPLILAVARGGPETVRTLLDAGANVNAQDVRGMTPLMLAVATDHPSHDVVRMLLARKPDTRIQSKAGETALDWALKFNDPEIVAAVRAASPGIEPSFRRAAPPARHDVADARPALQKTVALLQSSGTTTFREGGCASCHGANIVTAAVANARRKGISLDEPAAEEMLRSIRVQFTARADGYLERADGPDPLLLSNALLALAEADARPDRATDAMAQNLANQQLADGHWTSNGIMRPPTSDSIFSTTALAIRGVEVYGPPARRAENAERVARAARVLAATEPSTTEDSAMQVLGLKWAGADRAQIERAAKRLASLQKTDGGWAQTPRHSTDAYATGSALHALFEAGMTPDAAAFRKGVSFLLATQAADGAWHVVSRAPKFQPYFEGGFPYGHDQWISQWATGWAAIALTHSLPTVNAQAK